MKQVNLSISAAAYRDLGARGFKLSGLGKAQRIDGASRFEGPTSVIAQVTPGAFLDIGAFCNLSGGTLNNLRAGRYCSIATGVVIGTHEHPTDWLTTSRAAYYPEVNGWDDLMAGDAAAGIRAKSAPFPGSCPVTTLEPDVWIGQGAFLKSGITVGTGSIIGARATVVKDVPP
jgi:acetyltransferase-like isoleucine patch superfamily enzyme